MGTGRLSRDGAAAVVGLMSLVALHLWRWPASRSSVPRLRFGWLPDELAWRLAWMGLAFAYLAWFSARIWRAEDE